MMSHQDLNWIKLWKENSEIRKRAILWRKQNTLVRISKPSRINRARRLGYKSKQGIVVIRIKVGSGGMRKQRPKGGRRPKHLGVLRIKAKISMKQVAEYRVIKKYRNMVLLGSYFVYGDSIYYWYEVILADKSHRSIINDSDLQKKVASCT